MKCDKVYRLGNTTLLTLNFLSLITALWLCKVKPFVLRKYILGLKGHNVYDLLSNHLEGKYYYVYR